MFPFLAMTVLCFGGGVLGDWIAIALGASRGPLRTRLRLASSFLGALLVIGSRVASAPDRCDDARSRHGCFLYICQSSYWSVSADIARRECGYRLGCDEYRSANRRRSHCFAHALDRPAIWLDYFVSYGSRTIGRGRDSVSRRGSSSKAHRSEKCKQVGDSGVSSSPDKNP